jgi:hypothetical protein
MRWALVGLTILVCSRAAAADDLSELYDKRTLELARPSYEAAMIKTRDEFIWKKWLLAGQKQKLGKAPVLEFPLWAEGEARNNPLAFYADSKRGVIVLPVYSLKFLDDLCTAYAWLQINGYRLETVSEYTAMLRYRKKEDWPGGYRPPLKALGIPDNALKDPKVDQLALGHFVTARTFILLHEMGHIYHGHNAGTDAKVLRKEKDADAKSLRNEQEADRFAAVVMQRQGLPPLGMLVVFLADAHFSQFPPKERTHPSSGKRVSALADYFDDRGDAKKLRELGALLDEPDVRLGFVVTGMAGRLEDLKPRREALPPARIALKLSDKDTPFHGAYKGELVQSTDPDPIACQLSLERRGNSVFGYYTFGLASGILTGEVKGNDLHFKWEWAGDSGNGVLKTGKDGSFTGAWGYRKADSGAGTWTGRRSP